jgi:hypothetical protein
MTTKSINYQRLLGKIGIALNYLTHEFVMEYR